jgi:hypothetical protein
MANVLPKGKWSKHWPRCRNCATTLIPHKADGLCNRCYIWAYRQGLRAGFATVRTQRGLVKRTKKTKSTKTQKLKEG